MDIEFDIAKDAANIANHGVSLARAADFDFLAVHADDRVASGETRYRAFGLIDGQPHCLAFTLRNGVLRAISLRRAHTKEFKRHVQTR